MHKRGVGMSIYKRCEACYKEVKLMTQAAHRQELFLSRVMMEKQTNVSE